MTWPLTTWRQASWPLATWPPAGKLVGCPALQQAADVAHGSTAA
ncbi:MAG TPA: hypothetical protein VKG61_12650 [Streptosporangiaceae bacterium]|nr:hypothetical protein [Streptosporangiaceae bacterium]